MAVRAAIGGSVQPNPWTNDWVQFFREHRLGHMLRLAGGSLEGHVWVQAVL
jgi:fructosamine-3-kinase